MNNRRLRELEEKNIEKEIMQEIEEDEVQLDLLEAEDEEIALPGFRFHPTDEELVGFYLQRKVEKKCFRIDIIKQLDVYKYDPWDLAVQSTYGVGENECYFFCLRGRKYRNSVRPNRVTQSGYWKATGTDKKIMFPSGTNNCTGLKKSLVYYSGKGGKGSKTYWMMHEFRLLAKENEFSKDPNSINPVEAHETENWTICKIFHRNVSSRKKSQPQEETESAERAKSDHSNPNSSIVDSTESGYPNQIQLLLDNSFTIEEEMAINISIDDYNIEELQQSTEESSVLNTSIEDYIEEQQCCGVMTADVLPSDGDPYPNMLTTFGIDGCDFVNWDDFEIL